MRFVALPLTQGLPQLYHNRIIDNQMILQINIKVKWQLRGKENYVWTEDKRLYNLRTGRFIKKTLKGLTPGYWIGKEFIRLGDLRGRVEIIPKVDLPF